MAGRRSALIGAFVVGAAALLVLGLGFFGSGYYFSEPLRFVMYFRGSVNGLDVGAPVKFRGVKIGSVSSIELHVDDEAQRIRIPVFVDLLPKKVLVTDDYSEGAIRHFVESMIERGLRAQLTEQSLVTGKLMIELEYHPGTQVHRLGRDGGIPEIPTVPSKFEQLTRLLQGGAEKMSSLPLDELVGRLMRVLEDLDRLLGSEDMSNGIRAARGAMEAAERAGTAWAERSGALAAGAEEALGELRATTRELRETIDLLRPDLVKAFSELAPTLDSVRRAADRIESAAGQAEASVAALGDTLAPRSPVVQQAQATLRELEGAARSWRSVGDYLQRSPSALIYGKQLPGGR